MRFGVDESQSTERSVAQRPGREGPLPGIAPTGRDASPRAFVEASREHVDAASEREELLAQVRRLELALERCRDHAQRTSRLFLSATNYAEWVRENARREAELALRKARAKAETLGAVTREQERAERELARLQDELARLRALTDETRTRLSAVVTAGLEVLDSGVGAGQEEGPRPESGDLQDILQRRLGATFESASARLADVDRPEQ